MSQRGEAIVLIGFMGSGKSSVGRALAARTGLPRYDTDEMIAARFGLPIAEIFAGHGEAAFRDAESETLGELPNCAAVIVTGGGIVLRSENVERLRSLGWLINLTAEEEILFERATRRKTRPLLRTADPRATLAEMLRMRGPLYQQSADVTIDTSALRHEAVADRVLAEVAAFRANGH